MASQPAPSSALGAQPLLSPARLWPAALVLAFSNFIVVLDMTVANVSVPHIAGSLGVSLNQGSWVITSYSVAEAVTVPLTGWLAGRWGSLRMYLLAMSGFGLFSLLCGSSVTLEMMVVCRVAQGLCGGLVMPLAQTLLLRIFPMEQRPKAMLLAAMTTMLGPALGPNVGGFISDNASWHWIFLINIPLVMGCVFAARTLLPAAETPTRKLPIDVVGLCLMLTWVCSLQLMLDIGREHDWFDDPLIVALACLAAVGFVAFLIWELTDEHPVVDLRVFRHGGFTFGVIALSLCFGAYFASIVLIPQWLQSSMGYPAVLAGFVTSCTALAALTTSQLASKALARGIDARLLVSLSVAWLGCMALMRAHWTSESDFWTLASPQLIQGFGMSFFMLPLTTISLGSVPMEETATAAGIQNFVRTLAVGVATALVLSVQGNTQQAARSEIAGKLQPDDTMRQLSGAGFTDQGAIAYISNLVDREATTLAVDHVFWITAAVFFLCAAVVWLAPKPKGFGSPSKPSAKAH
ncbi:DHA2 family efflux MFS transporter permease subunit [Novosphingobium sp. JCM 18896]|uniref:DHA2 family efflux MFS transporter permease subunit n=1 Tax=Novosphingobium sp. JCM 18896 TaxID=2989731 RepID=UPI0022229826|nr:DHA2 family efflux MFS transporter permease subunit [Novosphingobium sp. JCM 18896]MCW1429066.1 DHA2 family efflux MFS transporter permease subunit [Novosphingobium sp. JCM 18896]